MSQDTTGVDAVIVDKTCSCGKYYRHIPEGAVEKSGLYWFTCSCGSTWTHPTSDFEKYWPKAGTVRQEAEVIQIGSRPSHGSNLKATREKENRYVMEKYKLVKPKPKQQTKSKVSKPKLKILSSKNINLRAELKKILKLFPDAPRS